ncbi:MAG: hypothetical protein OMM_14025, partial [Candidatus Magnetoglobus multicellularis str. Araruama]
EFDLEVLNTNDAPTVATVITDQSATEDEAFSFTFVEETFNDVDNGDILSYTATLSDDSALPAWLTFNTSTRNFSGIPTNDDVGTITIKVAASDQSLSSVTDAFDLTVTNVNDAPTMVNAIGDETATEDEAYSFTFAENTFEDVDEGDSLTYTATLSDDSSLPAWLTFNISTRNFSGMPTNDDVTTITIKVKATDQSLSSVTDEFDLEVSNTNDAPTVATEITDQSATEDEAFSFTFVEETFNDVDNGDILSYTATLSDDSALPAWLTFNTSTRNFSGIPTNDDVGTITIKVAASDQSLSSVTDAFDLTVTNVNDAPTMVNAIGDETATEDEAYSFTFAENTFEDVDEGDSLTY